MIIDDHEEGDGPSDCAPFDGTFEGTRRRQILWGLEIEPAERLRWLERTMAELRALKGRAVDIQEASVNS